MKTTILLLTIFSCNIIFAQWELVDTDVTCGFRGVFFTDASHGYAVGTDVPLPDDVDGGVIMETNDAGVTWHPLFDPEGSPSYPADIAMYGNTGFTGNRYSNTYRTTNGGATWELLEFEGTDFIYEAVAVLDANTALIAGWSGEVFKITDAGATITNVLFLGLPYTSIYDLQCAGDTCFLLTGNTVMRSEDAGDSWTTVLESPDDYYRCFHINPDGTAYVLRADDASNCTMLFSPDAGTTWDTLSTFIFMDEYFTKMAMYGNTGYIIGYDYAMMHTNDGGLTWNTITLEMEDGVYGDLIDITLINETTGYIVGNNGLIYRMGEPVNVSTHHTTQLQIFPNPVTDNLHVTLSQPADIFIYNATGAVVFQTEATHTIDISVAGWPAGYYVVRAGEVNAGVVVR